MGKKNKGTKKLRPSIQKESPPAKQGEKGKFKPEPPAGETARISFDKKDVVLCGLLILTFFFLGIWNIGSLNTPMSGWTPAQANESFYIPEPGRRLADPGWRGRPAWPVDAAPVFRCGHRRQRLCRRRRWR